MDQWINRQPRNRPTEISQLIFAEATKAIQRSKNGLFNKQCWNSWTSTLKILNLDTDLSYISYKNSLKMDHDLNVKHKTIELLEDNIGENLHDLGYGDDHKHDPRKK